VVAGTLPISADDRRLLSEQEVADGWRLACQASAQSDLEIDLAQWETPILADDTAFGFVPREGFGVAIDLGTTTLAAQLLDLKTGQILAVRTALNAQARHGADIMSRIDAAMQGCRHGELVRLIREQIGGMVVGLVHAAGIPGDWLKDAAGVMGGKGGGKPDNAQGGGPDGTKVREAMKVAEQVAHRHAMS